jgi:hypothetical protein
MSSTSNSLLTTIERIESLIVHGSIAEAQAELISLLRRARPERKLLAKLAGQCRRSYLPERAISLLHRVVRPTGKVRCLEPATAAEKSEYAAALLYVGACHEALKLLSEVDANDYPHAALYEGFAHTRLWDLEKAADAYARAAAHPGMSTLARLRAKVELAGCWIEFAEHQDKAVKLLAELRTQTGPNLYRTIYKDVLMTTAQLYIHQGKPERVEEELVEFRSLNKEDGDPVYQLFARQWSAVARQDRKALSQVRTEFAALKRFEDARAGDIVMAMTTGDRTLLTHLYFGTPYAALRARIVERMGGQAPTPPQYEWRPFAGRDEDATVLDLTELKEGDLIARLLQSLAVDFYKAVQVAELHERLYPNEYFNPDSSPDRLHQVMRRLRRWISQQELPLEIREEGGFYFIEATGPIVLRLKDVSESYLRSVPTHHARVLDRFRKLAEVHQDRPVTISDVATFFDVSTRSAMRYLVAARELGLVERAGTAYQLKQPA